MTNAAAPARWIGAGLLYVALVFAAGFVMGVVRVLVLAPALGETGAVAAEVPVMLAISWAAAGFAVRRFAVPPRAAPRLAMGGLAFAVLMALEAALSLWLFGRTLAEHLSVYAGLPARIGLAGQVVFALIPALRARFGR